jgi:glutamine cyclotransferase
MTPPFSRTVFPHGRPSRIFAAVLLALACAGCSRGDQKKPPEASPNASPPTAVQPADSSTTDGYEIVATWPHDRQAFTQGLVYLKGILIESTGLNGHSSLRKVDLTTGAIRDQVTLSDEYFAEGMTVIGDRIFQLTWQNQIGFVYDLQTLRPLQQFSYSGEGWGLTTDGVSLILSDGTNRVRFLEPTTFKVTRSIEVLDHSGQPLKMLNELEYIHGEIFANVWQTPYVVRIDPANGHLLGTIDFSGLLQPKDYQPGTDVLNGIAYDATNDRLFVTGKNWPKLFEVRLKKR